MKSSLFFYRSRIESASLDLQQPHSTAIPHSNTKYINNDVLHNIGQFKRLQESASTRRRTSTTVWTNTNRRRRGKGWQDSDWQENDQIYTTILSWELLHHCGQFIKRTTIRRWLAMFTTTTVTGDNPDNPNNNETTNNARYLETFKEPTIIKTSTTEGYIRRRTEMNLFKK
jgi:hypothetical protein